jgi:hypothetical protein
MLIRQDRRGNDLQLGADHFSFLVLEHIERTLVLLSVHNIVSASLS